MLLKCLFFAFVIYLTSAYAEVVTLEQYNIDPNTVTVSGLSSGGAFATQYHVAHSSSIMGAAIYAGIVYHCAQGNLGEAEICMISPQFINVNTLISKTDDYASKGKVDSTAGMSGDPVYIFTGTKDTVVDPENGVKIETYYDHYGSISTLIDTLEAQHCMPTDYYGPACDNLGGEYINNCEYSGSFEALNYLYANNLTYASGSNPLTGQLLEFNQKEFFPLSSPSSYSMDNEGYVYIPSACADKTLMCRLHIVFHGCEQQRELLGDTYVTQTGYLPIADANDMIMLFPQTVHKALTNPNGCWDWWGYTGIFNYDTNEGHQIVAIKEMTDRLIRGI